MISSIAQRLGGSHWRSRLGGIYGGYEDEEASELVPRVDGGKKMEGVLVSAILLIIMVDGLKQSPREL